MAEVLSKGSLFPPHLVDDLINKVKGKSSLVQLSGQTPLPFNGIKEFTFSMDSEINIVAENGAKSAASIALAPRTIVPIKVEYGARVSDEFMFASSEEQVNILQSFNEGYARKLAKGLDLMAIHGVNPRTGDASAIIGNNCFDKAVTQVIQNGAGVTADALVEAAIAAVQGSEYDVTGMAMSPAFRAMLAAMTLQSGAKVFPDLAWGNAPGAINGLPVQVNSTVSANPEVTEEGSTTTTVTDMSLVGDFATGFKWGYAKQIPMEIIPYGDPDNSGKDLKGYNQIYLRCETYLGWAVLDPDAFALIKNTVEE